MIKPNESHPLYEDFKTISDISFDEFLIVLNNFKEVSYAKKEFILKPGEPTSFQFFILKGCVRFYLINKEGKEQTVEFAVENFWACDYGAYFGRHKSLLYIECIEDCSLLMLEKSSWESLYKSIPKLEKHNRIVAEKRLGHVQRKSIMNLCLSAKDRYANLLFEYPTIENRLEDAYLASFLNVSKEALMKLRK